MRTCVRFVTAGLGVPPRWRTTSNASARTHARQPPCLDEAIAALHDQMISFDRVRAERVMELIIRRHRNAKGAFRAMLRADRVRRQPCVCHSYSGTRPNADLALSVAFSFSAIVRYRALPGITRRCDLRGLIGIPANSHVHFPEWRSSAEGSTVQNER